MSSPTLFKDRLTPRTLDKSLVHLIISSTGCRAGLQLAIIVIVEINPSIVFSANPPGWVGS